MARTIEELAAEAANLDAVQFAEFFRRLIEERLRRGLPIGAEDELVRQEDLMLSQHALAEDWEDMPDDWEAGRCLSSEAK